MIPHVEEGIRQSVKTHRYFNLVLVKMLKQACKTFHNENIQECFLKCQKQPLNI